MTIVVELTEAALTRDTRPRKCSLGEEFERPGIWLLWIYDFLRNFPKSSLQHVPESQSQFSNPSTLTLISLHVALENKDEFRCSRWRL